jgi:outer membrane lipoprotein carrier protein
MVFPVSVSFAETVVLNELVAKIQESYESAVNVEAKFVQEITIKSMGKTETEEGVVYFKKPKRMRWIYSKPELKELIINPKKAWLYIPEDNLVYIQDAKDLLNSGLTIRFISGIGKLEDDFKINFSQPDFVDGDGNYLLDLVPRDFKAGIEKILLIVSKDDFQVTGFTLTDFYGNVTRITFRNMKINNKLPDTFFEFTPPSGIDIYDLTNESK